MLFSDVEEFLSKTGSKNRLNPCCNGCCSLTHALWEQAWEPAVLILVVMDAVLWPCFTSHWTNRKRLNPCCNGCCSLTSDAKLQVSQNCLVLILVVMDAVLWRCNFCRNRWNWPSLNPCCNRCCSLTSSLRWPLPDMMSRLNPCCNGCCSLTHWWFVLCKFLLSVLILVVMDAVLWRMSTRLLYQKAVLS